MKILTTPNQMLLGKAEPVGKFDKKLTRIVDEMRKTLDNTTDPVGVGLAAPQVGILKRIFLVKPNEKDGTQVFINPTIISVSSGEGVPSFKNSPKIEAMKMKKSRGGRSGSARKLLEGCLSIPNIWGNVSRKKEIKLRFQDEQGKKHNETFNGFLATIIQHELDHLDGILFTKHALTQGEQLYRSYKNKKGEDEFEEIEV